MLSDTDYQNIKVSTLLAAETATRVVSSPSTVYYDEEMYARVYEAMTMLRQHLCVVYSELDLFRSMFREQIAKALSEEIPNEPSVADGTVEPAPAGDGDKGRVQPLGPADERPVDGVADAGAEPKPKVKRPYRRRNKAAVPEPAADVGSGDGDGTVGGPQAG
jgi:hypothetical protein